jgi:uncharacterized small protein (DUF1192 family)
VAHAKPIPGPTPKPGEQASTGAGPQAAADDELEEQLNTSLNDVLDLLAHEIERLKAELEFYRLSQHPEKARLERLYVERIDARQDRLEEIKALIMAGGDPLH